jgi:hypothetical protein
MSIDTLESVLERQTSRWRKFSPERKEREAFHWWDDYPDECNAEIDKDGGGNGDWILRLTLDRTRQRFAAQDELQAIDLECCRVHVSANSTDEECEVAEARRDAATAAWHTKYDRLWPAWEMEEARNKMGGGKSDLEQLA